MDGLFDLEGESLRGLVAGGVLILVRLVVGAVICRLLATALSVVPKAHRRIEPVAVWLLLVPVFEVYWAYRVFRGIAASFAESAPTRPVVAAAETEAQRAEREALEARKRAQAEQRAEGPEAGGVHQREETGVAQRRHDARGEAGVRAAEEAARRTHRIGARDEAHDESEGAS